jgi:hypothetical protein
LPHALRAEALELLALAAVTFGCGLTFLPAFAWRSWLAVAVVLTAAAALAWPAWPQAGLVTTLLSALALGGAALLARRQTPRGAPANAAAALAVGVLTPVAALFLAPVFAPLTSAAPLNWSMAVDADAMSAGELLAQAVLPGAAGLELHGLAPEGLNQRWGWLAVWVALPLALWGLWCAFRRGVKEVRRRRPPLAWVLLLYAVVDLVCVALHARTAVQTAFLPLASAAVLLAVFGVADVARSIADGLVLLPPGERQPHPDAK